MLKLFLRIFCRRQKRTQRLCWRNWSERNDLRRRIHA